MKGDKIVHSIGFTKREKYEYANNSHWIHSDIRTFRVSYHILKSEEPSLLNAEV